MATGAFPKGTAAAAFAQLFPPTRTKVDDSLARVEAVRQVLLQNHLPTEHADVPLKWSKYSPQAPEIKQHAALTLDDTLILLFGGAGGGGKARGGCREPSNMWTCQVTPLSSCAVVSPS